MGLGWHGRAPFGNYHLDSNAFNARENPRKVTAFVGMALNSVTLSPQNRDAIPVCLHMALYVWIMPVVFTSSGVDWILVLITSKGYVTSQLSTPLAAPANSVSKSGGKLYSLEFGFSTMDGHVIIGEYV